MVGCAVVERPFLFAHQGGWDEILLVAGPIVVIAGLLALVKRRVDRAAAEQGPPDRSGDSVSRR